MNNRAKSTHSLTKPYVIAATKWVTPETDHLGGTPRRA